MKQVRIIEDDNTMTNKETLKALRTAKKRLNELIELYSNNEDIDGMNLCEYQCELTNLINGNEEFEKIGLHFTQLEY